MYVCMCVHICACVYACMCVYVLGEYRHLRVKREGQLLEVVLGIKLGLSGLFCKHCSDPSDQICSDPTDTSRWP